MVISESRPTMAARTSHRILLRLFSCLNDSAKTALTMKWTEERRTLKEAPFRQMMEKQGLVGPVTVMMPSRKWAETMSCLLTEEQLVDLQMILTSCLRRLTTVK